MLPNCTLFYRTLLAAVLAAGCINAATADIVIGQSSPLSGVAGETGRGLALGADAYFKAVNAQGGIAGEKIRHLVKDDEYKINRTLENASDLINIENATALINFYGTGNITELLKSRQLDDASIPLLGVYTGAIAVREPMNRFLFHTRAGYHNEVEKIITLLADSLGAKRIGLMAQNDPFGKAGYDAAVRALAQRKLQPVATGWYEKNTDAIEQAAQVLQQAGPDAIVMISITKPTASFIARYRELGGGAQLYNISVANFEEVVKQIGSNRARGLGISQVFPYPFDTRLKVVRDYQETLAKYAPGSKPSYASLEGYINARILVEGMKKGGGKPSRESVLRGLEQLGELDMGGYSVSFSPKKRTGSTLVELTMISPTGNLSR